MDDKTFTKMSQLFNQMYDKFSGRVEDLEEEVRKRNDNVFTKMDAVYKEVLAFRQEQVMHTGSHARLDEELKEHERRFTKLESKVFN